MPGILPMKMIRVGVSSQSRIAQACDRCRSKKIRCDGVRPCCSQCANVGFECKTSDKLSRRAFPRGYTESLEDRVRALETEVRELKTLLDEKDEKIDMLSKIHNFSPLPRKASILSDRSSQPKTELESPRGDSILVEIPVAVQPMTSSTGTPTTAALIEAFEERAPNGGRNYPAISSARLLTPQRLACKTPLTGSSNNVSLAPPRLLSDQYINLYFQEWQPLLPILHRPTFLGVYEQYLADSNIQSWQSNKHAVAQLFLIFEIAAHSSSSKSKPATGSYESQWRKALSSVSSIPSISTLQSHILAQLCYLLKADYVHLLRHRAHAVSMVHQLHLHQGHKTYPMPPFEAETRKKVFWCQYVLDKFVSATTGTPQVLRDVDISVEYPADVDDENISMQGISATLPGEITKISSALALYRLSRILAKTLESLYPSAATYQLSLTKLHSLSDELDQWQEELPDHLRLRFHNDKPATSLISCRSPLLSLGYFYTRGLIHRPLLCYGAGSAASAATIVLAAAAKHELQILDLLDERSMNYTFPLSKQDLLLSIGFSILWQTTSLDQDSKLIKDNQKSLQLLLGKLAKESSAATSDFQKIASSIVPVQYSKSSASQYASTQDNATDVSGLKQKSTRKQLQAIASRLSSLSGKTKTDEASQCASSSRSRVYPSTSPAGRLSSTASLSSTRSAPILPAPPAITSALPHASAINLDYFPLSTDSAGLLTGNSSSTMLPPKKSSSEIQQNSRWEQLTDDVDPHCTDGHKAISPASLNGSTSLNNMPSDWPSDLWQITACDIAQKSGAPQSLFSFSEESLTSCDDLLFSSSGSHNGSIGASDITELSLRVTGSDGFKETGFHMEDKFGFDESAV